VGDVVIWDNYATLHSATLIPPATGPADTRLLHRISVKETPGYCP
jgi:taurine dioxygenase